MKRQPLLDHRGRPVETAALRDEVARPSFGSVRSPLTGYPADGLNPQRLAAILREADAGDAVRYLELAETIEERDMHYLGVLGTRRRSVSQIDITVEAHSDAAEDVSRADMVRSWLKRDELADELFDILDCLGKGVSFTEIIWDTSEGQWVPSRLEWRDPRWFRFAEADLTTPQMLGDQGQRLPLPAFKFVFASIKAKSGLPLRSGLARVAAWGWMFKAYTQRDWAIFTQTYGQPLRLGKFGPEASEADRETLFRAVANIAGDCAAIVPRSMEIEFVETGSVGATADLYKARCDWLDQQVSKAVLGQTATTDAIAGGHAVGREHRQVQQDIETADARALSAILNRDLIRPWMQLNFGPLPGYPRLRIARPEREDLAVLAQAIAPLVDRGLRIEQSAMRDRFGFEEPAAGAAVLHPATGSEGASEGDEEGQGAPPAAAPPRTSKIKRNPGEIKRGEAPPGVETAAQAQRPSAARSGDDAQDDDPAGFLADRLATEAAPAMEAMLARLEVMIGAAGSMAELREMLLAGFPDLDAGDLAALIARAMLAAEYAGRLDAAGE